MKNNFFTKIVLATSLFIFTTPAVSATPTATFHTINLIRAAIGQVVGYSSDANYDSLVCGTPSHTAGECVNGGPPQAGLVGAAAAVANQIKTVAQNGGISSCAAVPASGTATGNNSSGTSVTLTFAAPTHTIPGPWSGGGTTFQKRVTFTDTLAGESAKFAFEFNCGDSNASYVAINMNNLSNATAYNRLIVLYTGSISGTSNGIEAYLSEYSSASSTSRSSNALRIEYDTSTNLYNLWGVMNHNLDNTSGVQLISRVAIAGNYSSGQASVFSSAIALDGSGANQYINTASLTTAIKNAVGLTDGTTTPTAFDFTTNIDNGSTADSNQFLKKGCINFSSPSTAPTSNSYCTGLTPLDISTTIHPAPYLDSTGAFSMNWVLNTMPLKIETL